MKNKYLHTCFILIAILFLQCHKELSYTGNPDRGVSVNPDPITANIQGNIVDENDVAAAGVAITAGSNTTTTDANGFFHITKASLDKNTTLVTAQKDGYFKAYRVFAATSGCNQVFIKLIKRNLAGTISSSSGGIASLTDGSKISLPSNAVVNASTGSDYSGDIKVYASYINPTVQDINKIIPGSLIANNKNNKRVLLSSYGMLAVELESSAGEKLQIKQDNVATLTIPISSKVVSKAPATISLWYLDDKTGIWQEEGTATKNGNTYTGIVKHFSFWNCDQPIDAVTLSLTLKTPDSLPVVNAEVRISAIRGDSTTSAYGWTDSLGQVRGFVPANQKLTLEVIDDCDYAFYEQDIEALTQNTDIGIIEIENRSSLFTVEGTLVNCKGSPVTNGYALISFNGFTHYVAGNASGKFTANFTNCGFSSCTIIGVDEDAQQQGPEVTVTPAVTAGGAIIPVADAGNIVICGSSSLQYINYVLDDTTYGITKAVNDSSFFGYTDSNFTGITGSEFINSDYNFIRFSVYAFSAGTYPFDNLIVQNYNYSYGIGDALKITFTKFPSAIGEFYEGSFSGGFYDDLMKQHSISAEFRIRRSY